MSKNSLHLTGKAKRWYLVLRVYLKKNSVAKVISASLTLCELEKCVIHTDKTVAPPCENIPLHKEVRQTITVIILKKNNRVRWCRF